MSKLSLKNKPIREYLNALVLLSLFSIGLTVTRFVLAGNYNYWFLAWNLALAWIPLIFAWALYIRTSKHGLVWSKLNIVLFAIWILFLPNAFYILTDFIHLYEYRNVPLTFDVVLISSYALIGMIIGFTSLLLVHSRALKRFGRQGHLIVPIALFASGFAIYLGRELRWNSWDIIFNPFGILFDVSEIIINPINQKLSILTTLLFFGLLSLVYMIIWRALKLLTTRHEN